MKLIPITNREKLEEHGIYFSPHTLRSWYKKGKYPGVVIKVAGRVLFNVDRWQDFVEQELRKQGYLN